jgi:hypothetical protein
MFSPTIELSLRWSWFIRDGEELRIHGSLSCKPVREEAITTCDLKRK